MSELLQPKTRWLVGFVLLIASGAAGIFFTSGDASETAATENSVSATTIVDAHLPTSTLSPVRSETPEDWETVKAIEYSDDLSGECVFRVAMLDSLKFEQIICDLMVKESDTQIEVDVVYAVPEQSQAFVKNLMLDLVTDFLNEMQSEGSVSDDVANQSWLWVTPEIERNDSEIFSTTLRLSTYFPYMAHPINDVKTLNIDLENGTLIALDDLFEQGSLWWEHVNEIEPSACSQEFEQGFNQSVGGPNSLVGFNVTTEGFVAHWQKGPLVCPFEHTVVPWSVLDAYRIEQLPCQIEEKYEESIDSLGDSEPYSNDRQIIEWENHHLRQTLTGLMLLPSGYAATHQGDCQGKFLSTWTDVEEPTHQIRYLSDVRLDEWVNVDQTVYDPSAIIEEELLKSNPLLLGQRAEIVEAGQCQFNFTATSLEGLVTEGTWHPKWVNEKPAGYYLLITTGMEWEDSKTINGEKEDVPHSVREDFWKKHLDASGQADHINQVYFPATEKKTYPGCSALSSLIIDGETRTTSNQPPPQGFAEQFTDLECTAPLDEGIRQWYYERYEEDLPLGPSYGNEELNNYWYANIVEETDGPQVFELLAGDSCYWYNPDEFIRNAWSEKTTLALNPEVQPLPGWVVGVIEGEDVDQLIIANPGGPIDEWVGSPVDIGLHECCDIPFAIGIYELQAGEWHQVEEDPPKNELITEELLASEAIVFASLKSINPGLEGCHIVQSPQEEPRRWSGMAEVAAINDELSYSTLNTEIECNFEIEGIGSRFDFRFDYPIVEGTEHDNEINNATRRHYARGLATRINSELSAKIPEISAYQHNWFFGWGSFLFGDEHLLAVDRTTGFDTGGSEVSWDREIVTYDLRSGEIVEIDDLFESPSLSWKEKFNESATGHEECNSAIEIGRAAEGREQILGWQHLFWPTAEGLQSLSLIHNAHPCRFITWTAPWAELSDLLDPDGPGRHFINNWVPTA